MNLHSIAYYLLLVISCIVIFSCDEVLNPVDCTGVVGGSATTDDCEQCTGGTTGKIANYLQDCAGECNGYSQLDCENNCRSASYYDDLGDGYCDTIIPVLDCEEYNCDNGDCGTWNGSNCKGEDGLAAIQWDSYSYDSNGDYVEGLNAPSGEIGHVHNIVSSDNSIPNTFYWNNYYPAIVGTYSVSYCTISYPNNYCYDGYYTTYINSGGINEPAARNECFELVMWFSLGPSLYNLSSYCSSSYSEYTESCNNFFNLDCSLARTKESNDNLDSVTELEYQRYLNDQIIEQNTLDSYGFNRQSYINSSPTITKIDNSLTDIRISEIDNHPDVIVQEGNNYIMKYVKKEIPK